ncbi:MAG: hypothetical protein COB07_08305 [Sulfurovum sp.]|nr:MAG: hypothetical protein COB07_08305 [Sulfurovum sp.]
MPNLKRIIWVFLAVSLAVFAEGITPSQFKLEMAKDCEVLMLKKTPDRKAKIIFTHLSTGDCVDNMGCIREITQRELDGMDETKRNYAAWKHPVWCRVAVGKKQGWVEQQYLKQGPCENN